MTLDYPTLVPLYEPSVGSGGDVFLFGFVFSMFKDEHHLKGGRCVCLIPPFIPVPLPFTY